MLFKTIRRYMLQLLICVIFEDKNYVLRAHSIKNKKFIKSYEKQFQEKEKLLAYIKRLSKDYQLYYISLFLNSLSQGLVPTNNAKELDKFAINAQNVRCISLPNAQIYSSITSIQECKDEFNDYGGLDFIFSPFILLYECIKQEKNREGVVLYIYKQGQSIAIMICKAKQILFGSFFNIQANEEQKIDEDKEEDEGIDIDNYNFENLDALLDEKLDDLKYTANTKQDLSHLSEEMNMCSYIFSSIQEFYNNPLYTGNFINELVIFDNENISAVVLDYIEGEIFIKPELVNVDSFELMNELMCKELKI